MHLQPGRGKPRIYCANQRQGTGCSSRSGMLARCEEQIAAYLRTFTIPPDYRERLRAHIANEPGAPDDTDAQRQRLETRLARLKEMYGWGDIGRAEYQTERDLLNREMAALAVRESADTARLDRLADALATVARGWERAKRPEQRNRLAGPSSRRWWSRTGA